MKTVVEHIIVISEKKRASYVRNVNVKSIIGYKANGSFNVAHAVLELV